LTDVTPEDKERLINTDGKPKTLGQIVKDILEKRERKAAEG
jgi:hypothetical protein